MMYRMTKEEIQAYLGRIGIAEIEAPTAAYLAELHKAHVRTLSWQTVDIFGRRPAPMTVEASLRLILSGRSGYCFHLNGTFSSLLHSLGYDVTLHRAGVQRLGHDPNINSFHLGVTVGLDPEALEGERWLVDVGLGDLLYEPIPLQLGAYDQSPLQLQLTESDVAARGWRLVHDPLGSFTGVDFDPEVVHDLAVFKPKHEIYSLAAESPWMDIFLLRIRHAEGSNELRGCVWNKRDANGAEKIELTSKAQWLDALADIFGERLVNYSSEERDALWERVRSAHDEWKLSKEM